MPDRHAILALILPFALSLPVRSQQPGPSPTPPTATTPTTPTRAADTQPAATSGDFLQGQAGPFRLTNISLDLLTSVGTSTERDEQLQELKGGEHDPRKRGFTLQQAELQLNGDVDDFLTAQGVLVTLLDPVDNETIVELEEAWLQTKDLPANLQVKAGHYFTEFGRVNPLHPHAWDWQDQPVILSRVFGAEGMRAPGARVAWLAPTHQYLEFFVGAQNGNGETMPSFLASDESYEERPVGGRLFPSDVPDPRSGNDVVWTGRVATTFELGHERRLGFGASLAFGSNATGGDTVIYGFDFAYQWRAEDFVPGDSFVRLQGEYIGREFEADAQVDDSDPLNPILLPATTLGDRGGYVYGLVGWDCGVAAGVRVGYATGSGDSYLGGGAFGRREDPWRTDRLRISPMLQYQVSPFSRLRLQYDYDDSDHLSGDAHSVWLGVEIMLGNQPVQRTGRDGLSGCGCR